MIEFSRQARKPLVDGAGDNWLTRQPVCKFDLDIWEYSKHIQQTARALGNPAGRVVDIYADLAESGICDAEWKKSWQRERKETLRLARSLAKRQAKLLHIA
jgi:hypothetical protein